MKPEYLHGFWFTTAALFTIITIRYFLVVGFAFHLFWKSSRLASRRLTRQRDFRDQIRKEMTWSLISSFIFALTGSGILYAWANGFTEIYTKAGQWDWIYLPFSLLAASFLHDSYFYWTHRWMHHPAVFKWIHRVHHNSSEPTPWAAFSFHPLESLIQALSLVLIVCLVPLHYGVLLVFLGVMTICSVVNHLGYEIYPDRFHRSIYGKIWITPTHHQYHHQRFENNFGLYFRIWDHWMGTDHA